MFCPNCGKELPDGIKFCAYCGKSVFGQEQQSPDQNIIQDHAASEQDSSNVAGGSPQESVILPQKKSKSVKVFIGLAVALVLAIGVVFTVRSSNEQSMIREIPFAIYNDGGHDKVEAYYKDYFGDSMMLGCNVEDFSITKGTNSNSYNLAGKFEAIDTSQDSRPTYNAYVIGTVTTNFFRTQWSVDWSLQYQTPESQTSEKQTFENSSIIPIDVLYQAFSSNPVSASNTYANQYLNVSGTVSEIDPYLAMNMVEVKLKYYDGYDLFYATFEFDSSDESLNSLTIGESTVLRGHLNQGGNDYNITFTNASVYKSEAVANNPAVPVPDPATSAQPGNDYPDTEAGRILNEYAGSYADESGNYLFVGADGLGRARASIFSTIDDSEISVVLTDYGTNDFGDKCVSGNDYQLIAGSAPTYAIEMGFYGTDPDSLTVDVFYFYVEQEREYGFYRIDPSNVPYANPYY